MKLQSYGLTSLFILLGISACTPLHRASIHYKTNRDFTSLQVIEKHLKVGMPASKIIQLMGDPDYWPTDMQCYYLSNKPYPVNENGFALTFTYTLVITFIRSENLDRIVSEWFLEPIGE